VPPCLSGLILKPFTTEFVAAAVALDQDCLGGLWAAPGYERELANPNSLKLVLVSHPRPEANPSHDLQLPHLYGMGFAWSILEEAHITLLAVEPTMQGQGFGQVLLWGLLCQACRSGLERATLEVRASNQAALALYAKFGFIKAGKRRHYYDNPKEDGIILWRSGLQHPKFTETLTHQAAQHQTKLAEKGWQVQSHPELGWGDTPVSGKGISEERLG
jgi:[ribosomal protein S18]-alanine N-acetyltransferase